MKNKNKFDDIFLFCTLDKYNARKEAFNKLNQRSLLFVSKQLLSYVRFLKNYAIENCSARKKCIPIMLALPIIDLF